MTSDIVATPPDATVVLQPLVLPKPKFTHACNHCGLCCRSSLCDAAEIVFGRIKAPCPALAKQDDGRELCGLVITEQVFGMGEHLANTLGIGTGCSMADEDTTDEEWKLFDARSREMMFGQNNSDERTPDRKAAQHE